MRFIHGGNDMQKYSRYQTKYLLQLILLETGHSKGESESTDKIKKNITHLKEHALYTRRLFFNTCG